MDEFVENLPNDISDDSIFDNASDVDYAITTDEQNGEPTADTEQVTDAETDSSSEELENEEVEQFVSTEPLDLDYFDVEIESLSKPTETTTEATDIKEDVAKEAAPISNAVLDEDEEKQEKSDAIASAIQPISVDQDAVKDVSDKLTAEALLNPMVAYEGADGKYTTTPDVVGLDTDIANFIGDFAGLAISLGSNKSNELTVVNKNGETVGSVTVDYVGSGKTYIDTFDADGNKLNHFEYATTSNKGSETNSGLLDKALNKIEDWGGLSSDKLAGKGIGSRDVNGVITIGDENNTNFKNNENADNDGIALRSDGQGTVANAIANLVSQSIANNGLNQDDVDSLARGAEEGVKADQLTTTKTNTVESNEADKELAAKETNEMLNSDEWKAASDALNNLVSVKEEFEKNATEENAKNLIDAYDNWFNVSQAVDAKYGDKAADVSMVDSSGELSMIGARTMQGTDGSNLYELAKDTIKQAEEARNKAEAEEKAREEREKAEAATEDFYESSMPSEEAEVTAPTNYESTDESYTEDYTEDTSETTDEIDEPTSESSFWDYFQTNLAEMSATGRAFEQLYNAKDSDLANSEVRAEAEDLIAAVGQAWDDVKNAKGAVATVKALGQLAETAKRHIEDLTSNVKGTRTYLYVNIAKALIQDTIDGLLLGLGLPTGVLNIVGSWFLNKFQGLLKSSGNGGITVSDLKTIADECGISYDSSVDDEALDSSNIDFDTFEADKSDGVNKYNQGLKASDINVKYLYKMSPIIRKVKWSK